MTPAWTREVPTVGGEYEYRVGGNVVKCRVESMFGVMPIAYREGGGFNRVDLLAALNPGGEWRGPLTPPRDGG